MIVRVQCVCVCGFLFLEHIVCVFAGTFCVCVLDSMYFESAFQLPQFEDIISPLFYRP